jgi:type 1 glutamine amidotransferase
MQSAYAGTATLGIVILALALGEAAFAQEVPSDALAKIRAAAPDKAPAKPAQARRLLVYTDCKGFRHASIPYCTAALEASGQKTGAFEVVVSDDPAVFQPDSLKRFDGICFNNTTGELFDDTALKQGLLDWVKSGKGVIGIHAATDCFYKWPEYGDIMGGYFDGHPWNETVAVKMDDPAHPVNAAFGGQGFEIADEIYQFKEPYSREKLRVLLSLDATKIDMTKPGIQRADQDFAVSWVRNYGLGRAFFCSLGHREDIFTNPTILQHYLAGIQFALGDLPADATPSAQLAADGWINLFNNKDLAGWIAKPGSWVIEDGVLTRKGGGDIWTEQPFGDFVLDLEFKLDPETNSGVFLRTGDIQDCVQTGIEMQVLDSFGKEPPDTHDCGAIYDCRAPSKNTVKKPGEWNHAVITCQGSKIHVELNGEPILDMNLDQWTEAGKNPDGTPNKFKTAYKDMPRRGRIGLQDHGKPVWYRNIRIKPL